MVEMSPFEQAECNGVSPTSDSAVGDPPRPRSRRKVSAKPF